MASITSEPGGRRTVQFVAPDGKRRSIRLGKCALRDAEKFAGVVEALLAAKQLGQPLSAKTIEWLADLPAVQHDRLARAGLIEGRAQAAAVTLGAFLGAWLTARKGNYKPASLVAWGQVINAVKEFFGADCPVENVTPARAEAFRQSLLAADLRATTIHKRLQHARMVFNHAKRQGMIAANPFEYIRHRPGDASERRAYVPAADVQRAIEKAPNSTWKLLLALSRFAGL